MKKYKTLVKSISKSSKPPLKDSVESEIKEELISTNFPKSTIPEYGPNSEPVKDYTHKRRNVIHMPDEEEEVKEKVMKKYVKKPIQEDVDAYAVLKDTFVKVITGTRSPSSLSKLPDVFTKALEDACMDRSVQVKMDAHFDDPDYAYTKIFNKIAKR